MDAYCSHFYSQLAEPSSTAELSELSSRVTLQLHYTEMAQHLPSDHAILFLISITLLLLFYSCPSSGYPVQQKTTGNEWHQKLEQLEAIVGMRITGSDVTKANQYPYMVS
jgi:hypothetical protein